MRAGQNKRNFGYGRQLSYAGPQALRELFGEGRFATVQAHTERWQRFADWCRSSEGPGCNDARQISRDTLQDYASYLRGEVAQGRLAIATAQMSATWRGPGRWTAAPTTAATMVAR